MSERRVVITGIGVVSPVGSDIPTFWKNLTEGHSGISRYEAFDANGYDCLIAGEVKGFDPAPGQELQGCPACRPVYPVCHGRSEARPRRFRN